jgi:DAK2 domain fusion protein YloV
VLREAGVVDAGAQGLAVLLDGMVAGLRGEPLAVRAVEPGQIEEAWLSATRRTHEAADPGYCTEFVVCGTALDRDAMRSRLASFGESVLVVGDGEVARVHIHTANPAGVFAYAKTLGVVSDEKADDLRLQVDAVAALAAAATRPAPAIGVVAIAPGDGIEALMRSLGAAAVVRGGQSMNPSAGEIAAAVSDTRAERVVILPANANVVLAAEQAARSVRRSAVINAVSVPQAVAALVALNQEAPFEDNVAAMRSAAATVTSGEVVAAARDARVDGRAVHAGDVMGIVDGVLALTERSVGDAVRATVGVMVAGRESPLVTLYVGEGLDAGEAAGIAVELRERHACDVEVVSGGQAHYACLIGVE